MANEPSYELSPDRAVHRIGGAAVGNLRLKPKERNLEPPGISVFLGGNAREAADQVCEEFPYATRLRVAARTVGSATVKAVRTTGFDVMRAPTRRFANHGRLTHPDGIAGFSDENLERLSQIFHDTDLS